MGLVELLLLPLTLSSLGSTKVESASTEKHFALPSNCPNRCGNISIEYPFGIGHDCYRAGFNLTCTNHTDQPPRLSLGDGVLEVTRIDLDTGTVYVKTPVVTMGVDQESINVPLIDLQNWPYSFTSLEQEIQNFYTIDTYNRLYVSGCSVVADLNTTKDDLQGIVKGESSEVETALSWYIKDYPTCEEAKKNMETFACNNPNSDCYDLLNYAYTNYNIGYICRCSLNYKGNPYLANGCAGNIPPHLSFVRV
ncbi:hypothetical protein MUK42_27489 [Musa troglodytarum]|uniref:Wall-associated receptor kinase galacturonan-binding domain-containing protein n=1 Tax=Musa troglodytarum TaxID=320322 RepID=A0A9E7F644_9LILI|nr:hypothetical protein MUK42_27489 [Musa troglodytarum]